MEEFELIEYIRRNFPRNESAKGLLLPIGDDCSVIRSPVNLLQVTTADSLVEGNHFSIKYFAPKDIGRKAIRVNISDLASMGAAAPYYAWLTFAIPDSMKDKTIKGIIEGIKEDCGKYKVTLAGGNITSAMQFSIHVTLTGWAGRKNFLTRSGAKSGDCIFVTGSIGASTLAYKQFREGRKPEPFLLKRWALPQPKPEIGIFLAKKKIATSCIDISDGIFQDIRHIARSSKVGVVLEWAEIPIIPKLKRRNPTPEMVGFGEDYELLFTVPPKKVKLLSPIRKDITQIGRIVNGSEVEVVDKKGEKINVNNIGFRHLT